MQEISVPIKDLNSRQHVNDVEPVLSIDCHSPGLLKATVHDAATPPNFLQFARTRWILIATGSEVRQQGCGTDPAKLSS